MKKVLYITYDGLTDPLGQSQILPYLKGIASAGYHITILSFEKPERYALLKKDIHEQCQINQLHWEPQIFHQGIPVWSKMYDRFLMKRKAEQLHRIQHFQIVHCRSYIAAEIGLSFQKKFGTSFIFDMRGFWADEKRDGGSWPSNHFLFRRIYHFYKQKEREYIQQADAIVSLTHAGKREIETWPFYSSHTPIYVIPCSVDTTLFTCRKEREKEDARMELGIGKDHFVLSYLGAVGTWYMLPEMLELFHACLQTYTKATFLILTMTNKEEVWQRIHEKQKQMHGEDSLFNEKNILVMEAPRREVPKLMKASDINVSFIQPVYSKISSSPTKLGEVLSMGIPVITNQGVGDVKEIMESVQGGFVLDFSSPIDWHFVVKQIPELLKGKAEDISSRTASILDLQKAIQTYCQLYQQLSDDAITRS